MITEELYARIYRALSHPIRIKIIRELLNGPLCVCVLNENMKFSQSNLSQHLRVLKDAGILESEKDGSRILYSVKDREIKNLLTTTEKIIENQLAQAQSHLPKHTL